MNISKKKSIVLIGLVVTPLALLLLATKIPIKTFFYYTSNGCNSNLYGGGNVEYFKYKVISSESGEYEEKKQELESLNVQQSGFCEGYGFAPTDYTTIELFLL